MCGIAGIISQSIDSQSLLYNIKRMKSAMVHRGPDGEGHFLDDASSNFSVCLGHRRLAIFDPAHGQQPMSTSDQHFTVIFNGAIYNYIELRKELLSLGAPIKTNSDTEVLLHAYAIWGEDCVHKLRGMFAFAVWDKKRKQLFCARDRIGIKSLYYTFHDGNFIFGSEIKSLLATGLMPAEVNIEGLKDYISLQYYLGKKTLFKNIFRLEPGQTLLVTCTNNQLKQKIQTYWDLEFNVSDNNDEHYFQDHLTSLLEESVGLHLRSDVALGSHLSGGLDSSIIVAMAAQQKSDHQIKTFTGTFSEGKQYDESEYARLVSQHSRTDYHEVLINNNNLSNVLPQLIHFMDEPMAGPGLIPQYYVSQYARDHVTVALGGQGGDELFCGYTRYFIAYLESCLHDAINGNSSSALPGMIDQLPSLKNYIPLLKRHLSDGLFESFDKRYYHLIDRSESLKGLISDDLLQHPYDSFEEFSAVFNRAGIDSRINKMLYYDIKTSLPALLHVEDRTSMAVSLESRVPFLDHKLVEFSATIPPHLKFANGEMKFLLKQISKSYLPEKVVSRSDKMGFPVPWQQWTNGTSKEFMHDVLGSQKARERGVFNLSNIEKLLQEEKCFGRASWGLISLELWFQEFVDKQSVPSNKKVICDVV